MSDSDGSLALAADSGSHREALEALRAILATSIDSCESNRDLASLSQRFMDVTAELSKLVDAKPEKGTPLDELKAKRAARAKPAKSSARAAGS